MSLILVNQHLIVKVIVLLQLLKICTSRLEQQRAAGTEQCINEGKNITYECQVPAIAGILKWNGVGFDCPNRNSISNNVLALPTSPCPLRHGMVHTGACGLYRANLTCTEDSEYLISVITFVSNHEMNGSFISCQFSDDNIKNFHVRVGVTPNPPSNVKRITRPNGICHFEWTPPSESIGGIGGYNISYGDNCGNCTPAAGFFNKTEELTAECSECIGENSNMCYFEVNAVSEDCCFDSPLVEATSDSPNNSQMDITVTISCSITSNPPLIYVKWIYTFSEESRHAFLEFLITTSDQSGHVVEDILPDSKVRSKYIDSILLREMYGFVGDIWNVTVEVALGAENKFAYDSIHFSVEDTIMLDASFAVTLSRCIEVSINSNCEERSDTFQAQVQFIEGTCGSDSEITNTGNYTLQEDYTTCVPIIANTNCYSIGIFHNELELGRTELVPMPCILNTSNSTRVNINSTIGEIQPGTEVIPHNTILYLSCDIHCTLDQNQTRCANGKFQPSISHILRDGCRCLEDPQYIIIAYVLGPVGGIVLVVLIIAGFIIIYWKKNKKSEDLAEPAAVPDSKLEMSVSDKRSADINQ